MPATQRPQQKTAHNLCGFYEYPDVEKIKFVLSLPLCYSDH